MSPPTSRRRLPRFVRSGTPPPLQLTERDIRILDAVSAYRLLTREQIQRLWFSPTGTTACKRRLMLLYQGGLLGRTPLPLRNAYGASRAVYYIDRAGIEVLKLRGGEAPAHPVLTQQPASEFFLEHALDTADVRISFELACRERSYPFAWIDETRLRRDGIRLRMVETSSAPTAAIIPDGFLTITAGGITDGFAVEVDRATVTEERMRRRFRAYGAWAAGTALHPALVCDSLRVLIVVTNDARDRHRVDRLKGWAEAEGGRSLFWFTGRDALSPGNNIIESPVWLVGGADDLQSLPLSGTS